MYLKRQLLEGNNDVLECIEECNNYKIIAKPFLYRLIFTTIRRKGENALATASSGITATIFLGGTTTHSRIKIH
ncbi:hypothetical protein AMTRI_Chr05g62980 [Amborella trichopoda]